MRSATLRFGALFFILALSTTAAYSQPGLSPGSWEETTSSDLDGDGIPQNLELQLAQHFFPTIWYDNGEDTSSPGGNHDHREYNQSGRLLFRVRPHPQAPSHIAISYALLYRVDGGEGFGTTWACHKGDIEPFAITLKPDPACALGYGMQSIKTWAHEGALGDHESTKYADGCNWGFSVQAVSVTDAVLASENKHGNYLTDEECDNGLGGLENCNYHWTIGNENKWIGLNVGESNAQRHADLSPLGFDSQLWANQNFCGGPHSADDLNELNDCPQGDCPSAAETKFTDKFVAPVIFSPSPPGYIGCFTDDPNRALPHWLGTVNDIDTCVNLARGNGLAYAGLQWYNECWGGNERRYTQVGEGECNTLCASGQTCGGSWRNSIYATGSTPPGGSMQADSAIRGCSNWSWWSPVYQPDPGSCYNHCAQNGAHSCEWNVNGDCYVEFASGGCYVQGGFPGWWAAVLVN
jgi:hypothetical protein